MPSDAESAGRRGSELSRTTFVCRFALGAAVLGALDALVLSGSPSSTPAAFLLLALAGCVVGLGLQALVGASRRTIVLVGVFLGGLLAYQVGAHAKLGTQPLAAIGSMLSFPILATAALAGPIGALRRGWRSDPPIALVIALACTWAHRHTFMPFLYPPFGAALSLAAVAFAGSAGVIFVKAHARGPRWPALTALAALITTALLPSAAFRSLGFRGIATPVLGGARVMSDVDFDGSSSLFGGGDCAGFDSARGPFATEIPGDGVDQNCIGGDAQPPPGPQTDHALGEPTGMSVLLLTVDTVAFSRTSLGQTTHDTTPRLAEFARRSTHFTHAYAGGAWTSIALATILWGRPARDLQWRRVFETNTLRLLEQNTAPPGEMIRLAFFIVDERSPSLAARVRAGGVQTMAVVDGGHTGFLKTGAGLTEGFTDYDALENVGDEATAQRLIERLDEAAGQPAFVWGHFFGPHAPDTRHPGIAEFGSGLRARYDHELAAADAALGQVFDHVAGRDDLVVIVTADHGEDFGRFVRAHGHGLTEDLLRVPLVVNGPGFEAHEVDHVACHTDISETVLGVLFGGTAGLEALREDHLCVADTWRLNANGNAVFDFAGVIGPDGMYVRELQSGEHPAQEGDYEAALNAYLASPSVIGGRLRTP
ncbi:MAG: sulfatase-like hydrolase/transferase [Polyangiales bacterium]